MSASESAIEFEFARPTTSDEPMLTFGNGISYHAVEVLDGVVVNARILCY